MSSLYKQFKKLLPKGFPTGVRAFRTLAKKEGPGGVQALISAMPDDAKKEVVARIRENLAASLDDPASATPEDVIKATEQALYAQSKTPDAVTPGDETPANNLSDAPDTSGTDLGATPYQSLSDADKAFLAEQGFPEKDIKNWAEASLQNTLTELRGKASPEPSGDPTPAPAEKSAAPPAETVSQDAPPPAEMAGDESAIRDSQFGEVVGGEEFKKPAMDMSLLSQSAPPAGNRDILQFPGVRSSEAADTSPQLGLMGESSPEDLANAMDAAEMADSGGMPLDSDAKSELMQAIATELGYDVTPKQPIDFTDLLGPGGPQANAGQAAQPFDTSQDMSALFGGGQPSPSPSPQMSPEQAAQMMLESRNQSDFVPPFDPSQDMSQLFGGQGMPGQTPEMPPEPPPAGGFDPSQGMEPLFGSGPTSDKDPRFAFDPDNADYTQPVADDSGNKFTPMGDAVNNIKFLKNMGAGYPAAVGDFAIRNAIPLAIGGGLGYAGLKGLGFFPGADQNAVDMPEEERMQDLQSAHDQMQQRLMQRFVQ